MSDSRSGEDVEQMKNSSIASRTASLYTATMEINVAVPQEDRNQTTLRPSGTNLGHIPKGCTSYYRDTCSFVFIVPIIIMPLIGNSLDIHQEVNGQ